jgi:SPP1 gp7 family putative phage head morphogenesis protein
MQGDDLREIATGNLDAWKASGVVKTLKYYSADDAEVCSSCKQHHGLIVKVDDTAIGKNLPPLGAC